MKNRLDFLPVTPEDVKERNWSEIDFVYVTGDAYVDHPSFGVAIISRVLESSPLLTMNLKLKICIY
jgi:hypothetical protein